MKHLVIPTLLAAFVLSGCLATKKDFNRLQGQVNHLQQHTNQAKAKAKVVRFYAVAMWKARYGKAYETKLGYYYLVDKQYKNGVAMLTRAINTLQAEMNKSAANKRRYKRVLAEAYYNRACGYALLGRSKKAMHDLRWLDRTGLLEHYADEDFQFWKDKDLKSLQLEKPYQRLVAKWKAKYEKAQAKAKLFRQSYNLMIRAVISARRGKKAEALAMLKKLDAAPELMKFWVNKNRQFWKWSHFKSLENDPEYKKLVAKWKAWLAKNNK